MKQNQKGGLMLPYKNQDHSKQVFNEFLSNSIRIEMVSKGSYSLTFKVILPEAIPSDFVSKDYKEISPSKNFGEPIQCILVKIALIYDTNEAKKQFMLKYPHLKHGRQNNKSDDGIGYIFTYNKSAFEIKTINPSEFQNEINVQTDIYMKTIQYLQPLCPGIVYADILEGMPASTFLDMFSSKATPDLLPIINKLISILRNPGPYAKMNLNLGVIGMQFVSNSKTLASYITDKTFPDEQKQSFLTMGMYALLTLALDTGYNHNDFHYGNIMIENNDTYFYKLEGGHNFVDNYVDGRKQRAIIIDFGRATKIPQEVMNIIRERVEKGQFKEALECLCNPKTANQFVRDKKYSLYYGWICGNNDLNPMKLEGEHTIYEPILDLIQLRETAINENVYIMEQLHNTNPTKYPLLPVSNSFKNQLYEGMIGGKKSKRMKQSRKNHKKSRRNPKKS
jgi:hypothetical protein